MEYIQENKGNSKGKNRKYMYDNIKDYLKDSSKERQRIVKALTPLGESLLNNHFETTYNFYKLFDIPNRSLKDLIKEILENKDLYDQDMGINITKRMLNKFNKADMNLFLTYFAYNNPQKMKDCHKFIISRKITLKTEKQKTKFHNKLCRAIDEVSTSTTTNDIEIDDDVYNTYEFDENDDSIDMFNIYY